MTNKSKKARKVEPGVEIKKLLSEDSEIQIGTSIANLQENESGVTSDSVVINNTEFLQKEVKRLNEGVDYLNETLLKVRSEKQSVTTKLANADAALLLKQETITDQLAKLAERSKEIEGLNDKLSRIPNWIKSLFNV